MLISLSRVYAYKIGKYEVTAGQYTEFLNAVAKTDTYGLYNTSMDSSSYGCQITRDGMNGSYTYSVAAEWANRPVNYVSWGDAARFANWLTNGQPTGLQDLTTTESGSYCLNGATSQAELLGVTVPDATERAAWSNGSSHYFLLPSEDEWYKAAYHKNDGVTGNYFDYPTSSDTVPSNDLINPDPGNNANFHGGDDTIGSPYYRTEAGEFESSESPYGTFDQGGNVCEWNEAIIPLDAPVSRGNRGGSFNGSEGGLRAATRSLDNPASEIPHVGFRVCEVPEPATLSLLVLGGWALIRLRRK